MALIATFPLAAVRKCRLELGEPAAVMGLGILGRIALQLLKAGGATPVIAVDPVAKKRAQALEFGADYALDSFAPDFAAQMKALSRGGVKVAVEVTGFGKALDQVLRGTKKPDGTYEYETPVKFWMPFNGGIGFHDATWQSSFGGSRYQTNGSHGCVNLPYDVAAQLYNLITAGTPVVCHY